MIKIPNAEEADGLSFLSAIIAMFLWGTCGIFLLYFHYENAGRRDLEMLRMKPTTQPARVEEK